MDGLDGYFSDGLDSFSLDSRRDDPRLQNGLDGFSICSWRDDETINSIMDGSLINGSEGFSLSSWSDDQTINNITDDSIIQDDFSLGSWTDDQTSRKSNIANESIIHDGDDVVLYMEVVDDFISTHQTYNVYYYKDMIHTTVTHTASVVDDWIALIYIDNYINLVVGLDVEWRGNNVDVPKLCLFGRCLIFRISCCDSILQSLNDFLSDENNIFVGAGINDAAYKLWIDHRLNVATTKEL